MTDVVSAFQPTSQPSSQGPLAHSFLLCLPLLLGFCHGSCSWEMPLSAADCGSGACLLSLLPACKLHKILPGYKSILLFTEYVICGECGSCPGENRHQQQENPLKCFLTFAAVEVLQGMFALAILPQGFHSFSRPS